MKKIIVLLLIVIVSITLMAQSKLHNMDTPELKSDWQSAETILKNPFKYLSVIFTEDFEGGTLPAGWELITAYPDSSWKVVSSWSHTAPPNCGTYFLCFDPYSYSYFVADTEGIYTPSVSVIGSDSLLVRYDFSMQDYSGNGDFNVYVRTYNGSWSSNTLLVNHTSDLVSTDTLNLSSYLPADSVEIYFEFIMDGNTAWGIAIDNVELVYNQRPNYDAALLNITNPVSNISLTPSPFYPAVNIINRGLNDINAVWVSCLIDDTLGNVYSDSVLIDTLSVDDTLNISFGTFTPQYLMDYDIIFFCDASLDSYTNNDTLQMAFRTYDIDVSVIDIFPLSTAYEYGTSLPLQATYVNNATQATPFNVSCSVYDSLGTLIYYDEYDISNIAPAETLTIKFKYFTNLLPSGDYNAQFRCSVNHDINAGNDMLQSFFSILPEQDKWIEMPIDSTIKPIQWSGVCQDESSIWVIGGYDGSMTDNVQRFDTINGWSIVTHIPSPLLGCAAAIIDSKLYIVGGDDISFVAWDTTFIYDIAGDSWSYGTPIPETRGVMAGGTYDGKMYLIGGSSNGAADYDQPNYCYDPSADTAGGSPWDIMTPYPNATTTLAVGTNFFGAPASVNAPIICGGSYQGDTTFYMYNPPADTAGGTPWTDITQLNGGEMGTKAPLIMWDNNYAYMVGGDTYGGWSGYLGNTYVFEYASETWSNMNVKLNTPLEGSGGGILGDYIYSVGGTTGSGGIYPAPFEKTYRIDKKPAKPFAIDYTYPINRQLNAPVDKAIIVVFSQPVDTNYGFSYTANPDPGLLMHIWNAAFDTLTIFHDYLSIDETYYVEITEAYNDSGIALQAGDIPNPFGFNTGMTGINENNMYVFSLTSKHNIGSSAVTFDYILPSNGDVIIDIYNITGSKVKSLTMKEQTPGSHSVNWNAGKEISSGIYLYRAHYGDNVITGKMEIIK